MKTCVRQVDTVARFGGDEFVILFNDLPADKTQARTQAELVAEKIISVFGSPYVLQSVTGANPKLVKLEITESVLITDVEVVIAKMNLLMAVGISFSLDDFGTGYSSLSSLKRPPLAQLKIDQSFVRDILTDPNDRAIARMVIALADSMGLAVIAEGVETEAQRDLLAGLGCHNYQGYLFSPALPAQEFEALLARM